LRLNVIASYKILLVICFKSQPQRVVKAGWLLIAHKITYILHYNEATAVDK